MRKGVGAVPALKAVTLKQLWKPSPQCCQARLPRSGGEPDSVDTAYLGHMSQSREEWGGRSRGTQGTHACM